MLTQMSLKPYTTESKFQWSAGVRERYGLGSVAASLVLTSAIKAACASTGSAVELKAGAQRLSSAMQKYHRIIGRYALPARIRGDGFVVHFQGTESVRIILTQAGQFV